MKVFEAIGRLNHLIGECAALAARIDAEVLIDETHKRLGKTGVYYSLNASSGLGISTTAPKLWPGIYCDQFHKIAFLMHMNHRPFICLVKEWHDQWNDQIRQSRDQHPVMLRLMWDTYVLKLNEVIELLDIECFESPTPPSASF